MKYISTRGGSEPLSFSAAVAEGLAPDGGLYIPAEFPNIQDKLEYWQNLSYAELCFEFMEENRPLAKDVYLTRYSDGSEVITNYSMSDFTYKGVVAKARDYVLIDGRKK